MQRHVDQIGDRGIAEGSFDRLGGVIQAAVQGAQVDAVQSERAFMKATYRIDSVDHFQHRDLAGGEGQCKTAVHASLSVDQFGSTQRLHDFCQIACRDARRHRYGFVRSRLRLVGQEYHGPQCVFSSLRNHAFTIKRSRVPVNACAIPPTIDQKN